MASILQRVASGDERAVSDCIDEYGGVIWSLANRYLAGKSSEAEDAVQEIFVELWTSAHRFDPAKGSEPAFVTTIARRRLTDRRRRLAARPSVNMELSEFMARPASASEGGGEEAVLLAEEFDRLPEEERRLLWFSVGRGLTHREIGIATGQPIGTVKTRLRRAVMRLQAGMQERMIKTARSGGAA